jgi:hypothetical protein
MMARILATVESPPAETPAEDLAQTHVFGSQTGAAATSFLVTPPRALSLLEGRSRAGLPALGALPRMGLPVRRKRSTFMS